MIPERRLEPPIILGHGYDEKTGEYDCTKCGACCAPKPRHAGIFHYVPLRPTDLENHPRMQVLKKISGETGINGRCVQTCEGVNGTQCVALRGTIGEETSCAIYDNRPEICRQFAPGSDVCLEARAEHLRGKTDE